MADLHRPNLWRHPPRRGTVQVFIGENLVSDAVTTGNEVRLINLANGITLQRRHVTRRGRRGQTPENDCCLTA